jgi:hypothetical protein
VDLSVQHTAVLKQVRRHPCCGYVLVMLRTLSFGLCFNDAVFHSLSCVVRGQQQAEQAQAHEALQSELAELVVRRQAQRTVKTLVGGAGA